MLTFMIYAINRAQLSRQEASPHAHVRTYTATAPHARAHEGFTSEMLDIVGRARARRIMGKKVDVQK